MNPIHEYQVKAHMADRLAAAEARRVRAQFAPRRRTFGRARRTPLQ